MDKKKKVITGWTWDNHFFNSFRYTQMEGFLNIPIIWKNGEKGMKKVRITMEEID